MPAMTEHRQCPPQAIRRQAPRRARLDGGEPAADARQARGRRALRLARAASPRARITRSTSAPARLTYFAIREADKPADEDHPFGHAKIEAVAALAQTGFLIALAVGVALAAMRRLGGERRRSRRQCLRVRRDRALARRRSRALARAARVAAETGSDALAADALHFSSDLVVLAPRAGRPRRDAFRLRARRRARRHRRRALHRRCRASGLAGARSTRWSTRRPRGSRRSRAKPSKPCRASRAPTSCGCAAAARESSAISACSSRARCRWSAWPHQSRCRRRRSPRAGRRCELTRHRQPARARRRDPARTRAGDRRAAVGCSCITSTIQNVGGRACVTLDLEVDGRMSLGEAHEVATPARSGDRRRTRRGYRGRDPYRADGDARAAGREADPALTRNSSKRWSATRRGEGDSTRNSRCPASRGGGRLFRHLSLPRRSRDDASKSTHRQVDALERAVRRDFPEIIHVVGHAEPAR